jgi:CcmD family protein
MFFLAAAFIAVWVAVTAYVVFMSNRQRQLEQELLILQEMFQEKERKSSAK